MKPKRWQLVNKVHPTMASRGIDLFKAQLVAASSVTDKTQTKVMKLSLSLSFSLCFRYLMISFSMQPNGNTGPTIVSSMPLVFGVPLPMT